MALDTLVFALRYKIIRRDERYILAVDHSLEQCDYVIVVIRDMDVVRRQLTVNRLLLGFGVQIPPGRSLYKGNSGIYAHGEFTVRV